MHLSNRQKTVILIICFILSLASFLMKIPKPLRGNDKLLHSAFYFCAAAFLHLLFQKRVILILAGLFLFGVMIEYLQPLTNKWFHSRIHERFDVEDIYANSKGLAAYAVLALVIYMGRSAYRYLSRPGDGSLR